MYKQIFHTVSVEREREAIEDQGTYRYVIIDSFDAI